MQEELIMLRFKYRKRIYEFHTHSLASAVLKEQLTSRCLTKYEQNSSHQYKIYLDFSKI